MSSQFLAEFVSNAEFFLPRLIKRLYAGGLDWDGAQIMCTYFRQRGLCTYFLTADPKPVFVNLMQSAGAFVYFLKSADDAIKVTSHMKPFLDAIGGGFWEAAQDIAKHSRMTWNPDYEYEDDFLYAEFLMHFFFLGADAKQCQAIIDEHERASEGQEEARRDVCTAFLANDNNLLIQALGNILVERAEQVETMVHNGALPEEAWSWIRYFSSEGLALLRLAELHGFKTDKNYLHVPDPLRQPSPVAFDPNAWRQDKISP